jgi:hypothetical protein
MVTNLRATRNTAAKLLMRMEASGSTLFMPTGQKAEIVDSQKAGDHGCHNQRPR